MKTLSVRDLRQRWPQAEALLRVEHEIIITRDSKPVAKLVRIAAATKPRKRFDPAAHAKWQRKVSGGHVVRQAVTREGDVVVSALTELETAVQLRADWLGGTYRERRYRAYLAQLNAFKEIDPSASSHYPEPSSRRPCANIGMPAIFTVARLTAFTWPPWTSWGSDVS